MEKRNCANHGSSVNCPKGIACPGWTGPDVGRDDPVTEGPDYEQAVAQLVTQGANDKLAREMLAAPGSPFVDVEASTSEPNP